MIFDFSDEMVERIEVGDIVTKKEYNCYYIVIETNDNDYEYALLDVVDCSLEKWFNSLEEVAEDYKIYRKKDRYKLVNNF